MPKYKIGDKVVLVKDVSILDEIYLKPERAGKIITISETDAMDRNTYYFKLDNGNRLYVKERQIEGFARIDNWKKVIQNAKIQ